MKSRFPLVLWAAFVFAPVMGWAQSIPDLSKFRQPVAKCLKPSAGLIITQVGLFKDPQTPVSPLEIVATSQSDTDVHDLAETDYAAIHIYDTSCHLIYQQLFPGAGEATFETIDWNDVTLLHLVTMSKTGAPADEVIYNHILLDENYDSSFLPFQFSLTSDKFSSVFIGNIGKGKGFGVVETFLMPNGPEPPLVKPLSIMFQWKAVLLPEAQTIMAFVGPTVIQPPGKKSAQDMWPDTSYATGFRSHIT